MRWSIVALLLVSPASAHRPAPAELRTVIDDPTISWVIAGELHDGDEVYTIALDFPRPFALPFELMTEKRAGTADFRPAYAVVGAGLPVPSVEVTAALPMPLPEGWGAFVAWNDEPEREIYFEQVMRRNLYTTGSHALALREGPHEIWIWNPDGLPGDWQMGFGVEEDFGGDAFADIFAHWGRYAW
jgi:hypothetical protein